MHCPDCQTLLKTAHADGHEVCPGCLGEWLEVPTLVRLLRAEPAGPLPEDEQKPAAGPGAARAALLRRCPTCRGVLSVRPWASLYPPRPIALCPLGHGAWLPGGERARLLQGAARARKLLSTHAGYFTLLAAAAARDFERAVRPGGRGRRRRSRCAPRSLLARLLG